MQPGLYESLLTATLADDLAALSDLTADIRSVDEADQPHVLARHVQAVVQGVLAATKDPEQRLAVVNRLLDRLDHSTSTVITPA